MGLQKEFDWRGVAVAAISAPLSRALGNSTGFQSFANSFGGAGSFGSQLVTKFTEGIINAGVNQGVHHNERSIDWKMLSVNAFGQVLAGQGQDGPAGVPATYYGDDRGFGL